MKITLTNPYLALVNEYLIDSPAPVNINYFYNFGSLLGLNLVVLIATGVALAMHYNPSIELAFSASESIWRDVWYGWTLRSTHANAVSMFFVLVFIHIGRGLYYGSYRQPRAALWVVGVFIFIIMMGEVYCPSWYKIKILSSSSSFPFPSPFLFPLPPIPDPLDAGIL